MDTKSQDLNLPGFLQPTTSSLVRNAENEIKRNNSKNRISSRSRSGRRMANPPPMVFRSQRAFVDNTIQSTTLANNQHIEPYYNQNTQDTFQSGVQLSNQNYMYKRNTADVVLTGHNSKAKSVKQGAPATKNLPLHLEQFLGNINDQPPSSSFRFGGGAQEARMPRSISVDSKRDDDKMNYIESKIENKLKVIMQAVTTLADSVQTEFEVLKQQFILPEIERISSEKIDAYSHKTEWSNIR